MFENKISHGLFISNTAKRGLCVLITGTLVAELFNLKRKVDTWTFHIHQLNKKYSEIDLEQKSNKQSFEKLQEEISELKKYVECSVGDVSLMQTNRHAIDADILRYNKIKEVFEEKMKRDIDSLDAMISNEKTIGTRLMHQIEQRFTLLQRNEQDYKRLMTSERVKTMESFEKLKKTTLDEIKKIVE